MALIVLITICFLAWVFLFFVLVQWMRDTRRKATTRPKVDSKVGETREESRSNTVGHTGFHHHRAIRWSRICVPRARTDGLREDREILETRQEKERRMGIFKWKKLASLMLAGVFCESAMGVSVFAEDDKSQPPAKPATAAKI